MSANIGFEERLWAMADKLRGSMDASEYKHVVLGLLFLKYVSDSFEELYDQLKEEEWADPEDKDEYLAETFSGCQKKHVGLTLKKMQKSLKSDKSLMKQ